MEYKKENLKILTPNIPKDLEVLYLSDITIQREDDFTSGIVNNCVIENQDADHVAFKQVVFKNVTFKAGAFRGIDLTDVRFENCDLSNVDLSEAAMQRVEFINCKLVGTNISEATLRNVLFEDCNGRYSIFCFSDYKQVNFSRTLLSNADFHESFFLKVGFFNCTLHQTRMSGTKLKGIDLSSCELEDLDVTVPDLKGCIVAPAQVLGFANILELVVRA
jgi:uncharacterized protein YjbI with pentapeptide repeats